MRKEQIVFASTEGELQEKINTFMIDGWKFDLVQMGIATPYTKMFYARVYREDWYALYFDGLLKPVHENFRRIPAINVIRKATGWRLKEGKEIIDNILSREGQILSEPVFLVRDLNYREAKDLCMKGRGASIIIRMVKQEW